jgi:hypothetical protein
VGGHQVTREQVATLIGLLDAPHVRLHVVPADTDVYAGVDGQFALATLPETRLAGYVDTQITGIVAIDPEECATLVAAWESCRGEALPHRQSVGLVKELAAQWT